MHELSIAHAIVETVTDAIEAPASGRVRRVRLRIGALSGVAVEALAFCFEVASQGTLLEGSVLEVDRIPVAIRCEACRADRELPDPPPFRCPVCDTPSATIVRGKELEVEFIEVDDPAPPNDTLETRP